MLSGRLPSKLWTEDGSGRTSASDALLTGVSRETASEPETRHHEQAVSHRALGLGDSVAGGALPVTGLSGGEQRAACEAIPTAFLVIAQRG